jgi:hypothetical protein
MLGLVMPASAQVCSHADDFSFYSHGDYVTKVVRIKSPLDFLPGVSQRFDEIKRQLPIQTDKIFSASAVSAGRALIETQMKAAERNLDPRSRILIVFARIENCHETTPLQLDVVYWVLNSNYNSYFSHSWETKSDEIQRPATAMETGASPATATQAKRFFFVTPFIDYNRTRQLSGGANVVIQTPGGIFDTAQLTASGSATSNSEEVQLVGARAPQHTSLNYLEYRFAYAHTDTPAGNNRLREGTLSTQFFGATKPLGANHLVLRFGTSLEGGNRQTELNSPAFEGHSIESSGYGALKSYFGATARTRSYSFALSYGLQAGTRGATTAIDFIKHIADIGLTARWFLKDDQPGEFHKSLAVEAQFTGGAIQTLGRLPVAERFFGGNAVPNFIAGDSWRIRGGASIRSIPQNRLNATSTMDAIGGTSFYSANLTFSRAIWGRPIIPKEMAGDPQFLPTLTAARTSAREALITAYKNKLTQVYEPLIANLAQVETDLTTLRILLENLPSDAGSEVKDAASDAHDSMVMASTTLEDKSTLPGKLDSLLKEPNTAACQDEENCSILTQLRFNLGTLLDALNAAHADAASHQAKTILDSLASQQPHLVNELNSLDFGEATRQADADMQMVGPVLNSFLNEINIVSVSPVGIFDVARIWPDRVGTRFGIGGGVRLSLVNFNVTLGYAVNPKPRFQESRGAFFFSMDVTELFR